MFDWFAKVSPEGQLALILQAAGFCFTAGVYAAERIFMARRVKKLEETSEEHGEKLQEHGETIAVHGEAIAVLRERAAKHR